MAHNDAPSVSSREAAKLLYCTSQWVWQLYRRGTLEGFKTTPRRLRIYTDSIAAYINANNNNHK